MTLNSIYPYMENVEDITTAKIILEALSDPNGYYFGIYNDIKKGIKSNVKESKIRKMINKYYEDSLIDHYEYLKAISFSNEENLFRKLLGQESFAQSISKIKTTDELKKYLEKIKSKKGEEIISYDTYVPRYKQKK